MIKDELVAAASPCFVWCEHSDRCGQLDDKFRFTETLKSLGMPIAAHFWVISKADVINLSRTLAGTDKRYMLKPVIAKHPAAVLNRLKHITEGPIPFGNNIRLLAYLESFALSDDNPHIVMELLYGEEYATTGVFLNGKMLVHSASRASAVQTAFSHERSPILLAWAQEVGEKLHLTGSLSFDVIVVDNVVFPLECNPRLHTLVVNFSEEPKTLVDAYLAPLSEEASLAANSSEENRVVQPTTVKLRYWFAGELIKVGLELVKGDFAQSLSHVRNLCRGQEATFRWKDPIPFFWLYHVQTLIMMWSALIHRRPFNRIDFLVGRLHYC
jgi:hypothetical protein